MPSRKCVRRRSKKSGKGGRSARKRLGGLPKVHEHPTSGPAFDAIVVTAASHSQAHTFKLELDLRQAAGVIPAGTLVLAVPDPAAMRVGSGGATLNALAEASQQLCTRAGFNFLNYQFLKACRILILHSGGDSSRLPICSVRGKAFCNLPSSSLSQVQAAPIDFLIQKLIRITTGNAPVGGVMVATTDVLVMLPDELDWNANLYKDGNAFGIGIEVSAVVGHQHGVYIPQPHIAQSAGTHLPVLEYLHKAPPSEFKKRNAVNMAGNVLLDCGIVYLSAVLTEQFLRLHTVPPLAACTYNGVDNGASPVRFELYTDVLHCMNPSLTKEAYLALPHSNDDRTMGEVRELLWSVFHPHTLHVISPPGAGFMRLSTTKEYLQLLSEPSVFTNEFKLEKQLRCYVDYPDLSTDATLVNSLLLGHGVAEHGSLVENCKLVGSFHVQRDAVVSGVRSVHGLKCRSNIVMQEVCLDINSVLEDPELSAVAHTLGLSRAERHKEPDSRANRVWVLTVLGLFDQVKLPFLARSASLCNRPWQSIFEVYKHHIQPDRVWPQGLPDEERSLWNARLFPIMVGDATESVTWLQETEVASVRTVRQWARSVRISLQDVLRLADAKREQQWRQELAFEIDKLAVESILVSRQSQSLQPIIYRQSLAHKWELLPWLDHIASDSTLDIASRALCAIADVLGSTVTHMHSRNGPSRNQEWSKAFDMLVKADSARDQAAAIRELASVRNRWLASNSPHLTMRAARHYDGATARLIRKCTETGRVGCSYGRRPEGPLCAGKWLHVTAPARIDLAGGWTDTPPICYEHGGKVVNVAVRLDGGHSIGASVRVFQLKDALSPSIVLRIGNTAPGGDGEADDCGASCLLSDVTQFSDHGNPSAPGCLAKCVLLVMGVVSLSSTKPLQEQLQAAFGKGAQQRIGLELRTWCLLPQGTGLGVSSILAAAACAVIGRALGRDYSDEALCHVVMLAEQLMTTGGGWQDQVGGAIGGFKATTSAAALPLRFKPKQVLTPLGFVDTFDNHLLLVYSGSCRLARNLLQNTVRRWFHRGPVLIDTVAGLIANADKVHEAIQQGDLGGVGAGLSAYWRQKKLMASPPASANNLVEAPVEPEHVSRIIHKLGDSVHGVSLCGAGGGGFMVIITKEPVQQARPKVQQIIDRVMMELDQESGRKTQGPTREVRIYGCQVCPDGLTYKQDATG